MIIFCFKVKTLHALVQIKLFYNAQDYDIYSSNWPYTSSGPDIVREIFLLSIYNKVIDRQTCNNIDWKDEEIVWKDDVTGRQLIDISHFCLGLLIDILYSITMQIHTLASVQIVLIGWHYINYLGIK